MSDELLRMYGELVKDVALLQVANKALMKHVEALMAAPKSDAEEIKVLKGKVEQLMLAGNRAR